MKKILSITLCALMLLTLLPMEVKAAPYPAVDFNVTVNKTNVFAGDAIIWKINVTDGVGPFEYSFDIYRNDNLYLLDGWHTYSTFTWKPSLPGFYKINAWVHDKTSLDTANGFGLVTYAGLRAPKITGVTAINGTSLKITWNKVPGTGMYRIWRSTTKSGIYELIKETASTTYLNTYRTTGTLYYYQVSAYLIDNDLVYYASIVLAPVAGVPLNKTTVSAVTAAGAKRLKVSWTKVPSATGYIVYRSLSANGTYAKITTTTALSFTNTGLTSGKIYYYKVKPYKHISTANYYGPLSAYKAGKVTK